MRNVSFGLTRRKFNTLVCMISFLLAMFFAKTLLAGQMSADKPSSAANVETVKVILIRFDPPSEKSILKPLREQPPKVHRFSTIEHRRLPESPPRQRNPELSSEQLVILALNEQGREVTRIIIPDPRLIRAETAGPLGEITSKLLYRETGTFTVAIPDYPSIQNLKICHPHWTGNKFILEPLGEIQLP